MPKWNWPGCEQWEGLAYEYLYWSKIDLVSSIDRESAKQFLKDRPNLESTTPNVFKFIHRRAYGPIAQGAD